MYGALHVDGSGENNPPVESFSDLYDELLSADDEHPDVSIIHDDSGWSLSAYRSGLLVFEHLGHQGEKFHMRDVHKKRVLELWRLLAAGDIAGILSEPWKEGYGQR